MGRRTLLLLIAGLVVVGVIGVGGYLFLFGGSDAPPPAELSGTGEQAGDDGANEPAGIDGNWQVVAGETSDPTFVGYRVSETLLGVNRRNEAVGRTNEVQGTVTITGTTVEAVELTANLETLQSDETRRDTALRSRGLEIDEFPTATFTLTDPIDLGQLPSAGQAVNVTAVGELTLHGVTSDVSVPLEAVLVAGSTPQIEIVGSLEISMADFEIEPPNVGGVVSVDDRGTLELHVFLERA